MVYIFMISDNLFLHSFFYLLQNANRTPKKKRTCKPGEVG
jgi:hypothetical protein